MIRHMLRENRRDFAIAGVAVLVVVAFLVWVVVSHAPSAAPTPPHLKAHPHAAAKPPAPAPDVVATCVTATHGPFLPRTAHLAKLAPITMYSVARLPRDVPGVPPLTASGKHAFAWDIASVKPGSASGLVVMTAHSWPDGTALGNWLMTHLAVGDVLVLDGDHGQRQCYRIAGKQIYPRESVPWTQTYGPHPPGTPPRLTITICYWPRLGPENWLNREVWTAVPITAAHPAAATTG